MSLSIVKVTTSTIIMIAVLGFIKQPVADARGFGGGGGGFRGGGAAFGGYGGGFRDDGGRGFSGGYGADGDRGFGGGDRDARPLDDNRPSAFSTPYGGDGTRAGGDQPSAFSRPYDGGNTGSNDSGVRTWNAGSGAADANRTYGTLQRGLATDGGFGGALKDARAYGGQYGEANALHVHPGQYGTANAVRDAARNATSNVSRATLATRGTAVRRAFNHYDAFGPNWWRNHAGWYYGWWGHRWPWTWGYWGDLAGWWGWPVDDEPYYYDYGDNITYQGDEVYYGTQPAATSDQYYNQAQTLANSGSSDQGIPPADNPANAPSTGAANQTASKDWKPLGVFSLVQGSQSNTSAMFQIAVNKSGIIRGNYYNVLTDQVTPIKGAIDKKTKRVAWTVGDNNNVVYDTGLANLLKDQSPILVHMGKSNTQQWELVRLKQPDGQKG